MMKTRSDYMYSNIQVKLKLLFHCSCCCDVASVADMMPLWLLTSCSCSPFLCYEASLLLPLLWCHHWFCHDDASSVTLMLAWCRIGYCYHCYEGCRHWWWHDDTSVMLMMAWWHLHYCYSAADMILQPAATTTTEQWIVYLYAQWL